VVATGVLIGAADSPASDGRKEDSSASPEGTKRTEASGLMFVVEVDIV